MPICREGHNSTTEDYCDECGAPIGAGPTGADPAQPAPDTATETCPVCGVPRSGRFCEADGYDFVLRPPLVPAPGAAAAPAAQPAAAPAAQPAAEPAAPRAGPPAEPAEPAPEPPAAAGLVAVIAADRPYYETVMALHGPDAAAITFPAVYPQRRIRLTGAQMLIGRRSTSRGLDPQIDLAGPPEDPGVSHVHAVLQPHPEGGWAITDPGSTNGTTLNDDPRPIEVGVPVRVGAGDRIHVGAWTTITLEPAP